MSEAIDIEGLRERARELGLVGRELLTVDLINTTPALVGGWRNGSVVDPERLIIEPPRPTDIAGKIRWWLRSIIAAGVYEEHGKHLPIHALDRLAAKVMGSAAGRRGWASKVVIAVRPEPIRVPNTCAWAGAKEPENKEKAAKALEECRESEDPRDCFTAALLSPRIKLSTMEEDNSVEKFSKTPLPPGYYRFKLIVRKRPGTELSEAEEKVLGLATGMALFFTGIGRGVTRGYGKLAPASDEWGTEDSALAEWARLVWRKLGHCSGLRDIAKEAAEAGQEYVRELLTKDPGKVLRIINTEARKAPQCPHYPLAYTLHPEFIEERSIPLRAVGIKTITPHEIFMPCCGDPWCVVAAINYAVLKTNIKNQVLGKEFKGTGIGIPSYLLGLPRRVYKHRRDSNKELRMISSIMFTPIYIARKIDKSCKFTPQSLQILGFRSVFMCATEIRDIKYTCMNAAKRNKCENAIRSVCGDACVNNNYYGKIIEKIASLAFHGAQYGGYVSDAVDEYNEFFESSGGVCRQIASIGRLMDVIRRLLHCP